MKLSLRIKTWRFYVGTLHDTLQLSSLIGATWDYVLGLHGSSCTKQFWSAVYFLVSGMAYSKNITMLIRGGMVRGCKAWEVWMIFPVLPLNWPVTAAAVTDWTQRKRKDRLKNQNNVLWSRQLHLDAVHLSCMSHLLLWDRTVWWLEQATWAPCCRWFSDSAMHVTPFVACTKLSIQWLKSSKRKCCGRAGCKISNLSACSSLHCVLL